MLPANGVLLDSDRIAEYDMKLMDIDSDQLGIPDTDYDAKVTMPASEFTRIVRDLSQLGESVRIEVSKEGIRFTSEGEAANGNVLLKHSEGKIGKVQKDGSGDEGEGSGKAKVKQEKGDDVDMDEEQEKDQEKDQEKEQEQEFKPNSDDEGEEEQDAEDEDEESGSKKRKKKVCQVVSLRSSTLTRFSMLYRRMVRQSRAKKPRPKRTMARTARGSKLK